MYNGIYYKLSAKQTDLNGTVTSNLKGIDIQYEVAAGMAITQVPKLDFGKIQLLPKPTYYNIVNQTDDLQIKTTDSLVWKLFMSAKPFYRVTEDNQLDKADYLDVLLYYRKPNEAVAITKTSQEVSSSVDLAASASETHGNTTITSFQKVWWNNNNPPEQVSGPIIITA